MMVKQSPIAAALLMLLAGCGGAQDEAGGDAAQSAEATPAPVATTAGFYTGATMFSDGEPTPMEVADPPPPPEL